VKLRVREQFFVVDIQVVRKLVVGHDYCIVYRRLRIYITARQSSTPIGNNNVLVFCVLLFFVRFASYNGFLFPFTI